MCETGATVNDDRGLPTLAAWTWIQSESVCEDTLQRRESFVSAVRCTPFE